MQAETFAMSASRCDRASFALSDPVNERQRRQHHPELAEDLAREEVEAAEGQPQEQDAVGDQADQAAGQHRQHQPARLQRRVDGEVGELRQQERGGRGMTSAGGATAPDSAAPATMAASAAARPSRRCTMSRSTSARPIISTPDGAISGCPRGPTARPAPGRGRAAGRRPCRRCRSSSWRTGMQAMKARK